MRTFLADYGVPLMVALWSIVSFALTDASAKGIPARLHIPDIWTTTSQRTFSTLQRLRSVPGPRIGYAAVPALVISMLFYFDHNVSGQMAQRPEFCLLRPPAYHWDLAVLSLLTVCYTICVRVHVISLLCSIAWCQASSYCLLTPPDTDILQHARDSPSMCSARLNVSGQCCRPRCAVAAHGAQCYLAERMRFGIVCCIWQLLAVHVQHPSSCLHVTCPVNHSIRKPAKNSHWSPCTCFVFFACPFFLFGKQVC